MIEHCLYGVKVFCEFDLFGRPVPLTALAPGEHLVVNLLALPDVGELPVLSEVLPLAQSRSRELSLRSDRVFALSRPGQPWQMDLEGLVSFYWRAGEPTLYYKAEADCTKELFVFWFVHVFLPLYLSLERGYDFIHAAAVEVDMSQFCSSPLRPVANPLLVTTF